jgi:hypothetical protein
VLVSELRRNPRKLDDAKYKMDALLDDLDFPGPPVVDPLADLDVPDEVAANDNSARKRVCAAYLQLSVMSDRLVSTAEFKVWIIVCIIIASVMVGVQAVYTDWEQSVALYALDASVSAIFLLECTLKILAEGFTPWEYFNDSWQRLDFIIVVGSYSPVGSLALLLRMIRLFRILKLLKVHHTALTCAVLTCAVPI